MKTQIWKFEEQKMKAKKKDMKTDFEVLVGRI